VARARLRFEGILGKKGKACKFPKFVEICRDISKFIEIIRNSFERRVEIYRNCSKHFETGACGRSGLIHLNYGAWEREGTADDGTDVSP